MANLYSGANQTFFKLGPSTPGKVYLGPQLIQQVSPWAPTDLGVATAFWFDASDAATVVLNGGNVSQWSDKSGNNRHLTQGIAANQPTYTTHNAKKWIDFARIGDFLINTSVMLPPPFSVFIVAQLNSTNSTFHYFDGAANFSERVFLRASPNATNDAIQLVTRGIDEGDGKDVESMTSAGLSLTNNPHILQVAHGGTTSGAAAIWHNGTLNKAGTLGAEGFNGLTLGQWYNYSASGAGTPLGLLGYIGEFVVVSGALSASQRQETEGYLAHKWGLAATLPSAHPYKAAPPFTITSGP